MGTKIRKQVYIEREQDALLKQMARDTGMSESQIIREAINRHARELDQHERRLRAWANTQAFITKRIAGQPEQVADDKDGRTWRREDLYE